MARRVPGEVFTLLHPRSVLLALVAAAVAAGYVYSEPMLWAFAELASLLLLASWLLVRAQAGTLRARRNHAATAFEGAEVSVTLWIQGVGWLPLSHVEIEEPFAASVAPAQRFLCTEDLSRGRAVRLDYDVRIDKPRGHYRLGPPIAAISDPFGLFTRRFAVPAESSITVYPATFSIRHLPLKGRSTAHHVGQRTTSRAGSSEYFFGTREYRRGDPLRLIHWPSSAHRRRLVVKEFELSVATEVTIFIDLARATYRGLGRASTLERAVTLAASVADHALRAGHTVRLVAEGKEPLYVPHGSGSGHYRLILEALTRAEANGDVPLRQVLARHVPRIAKESSVVIIWNGLEIDLADYESLFQVLRTHSVKPVAIFVDDSSFLRFVSHPSRDPVDSAPAPHGVEAHDPLSLKRREERERMVRAGIDVYVVGDEDPSRIFRQPWEIARR